MTISDSEIERIIPVIQMNCAVSGGCAVYKNKTSLTAVMGDEELCWFSHDEGRNVQKMRTKLMEALNKLT